MTDFNEKKPIVIELKKDSLIDVMRKNLGSQSLSKNDVESMNLMCDILIKGDVGERFLLLNYIQKVHNIVMKPRCDKE